MKRFTLKCGALLLALAAIIYLGGVAYRHTNHYRNLEYAEETVKFYRVPAGIDIAVFGSSHGRNAFQYAPTGKTMFNFSMSSQTPQYDEKMMLQFADRFHEGTLIILTMSYFSPFWTDDEETFNSKQERYYRVLDASNIVNVDEEKYYLQKFSPLLTEDITSLVAAFLKNEPLNAFDTDDKIFSEEHEESERERILRNHLTFKESGNYPGGNPVMMDAFRDILTMSRQNGWQSVLVTPPYTDVYNECFSDDFYPAFYARVEELTKEFDVPYLDYSHDVRFASNYDLFQDIDHLNATGAEKFDEIFFADLAQLQYE